MLRFLFASLVAVVTAPALALAASPSHLAARAATGWQLVAVLDFAPGSTDLTEAHCAQLEAVRRENSPERHEFFFEGDHDPSPYRGMRPQASLRLNERLAETRWQSVAQFLGVTASGAVRATGTPQARVFTRPRPEPATAGPSDIVMQLQRQIADLGERLHALDDQNARLGSLVTARVAPDTVFRGIQLESVQLAIDKRTDDRFYEAFAAVELGLLRSVVRGERQRSGLVLAISNGSTTHTGFQAALVFEDFGFGNDRARFSPVVSWHDPSLRASVGSAAGSQSSLWSRSDPSLSLGLRLAARPWEGARLRIAYLGVGSRVHADRRPIRSLDLFEARAQQRLSGPLGVEAVAVFDERFEREMSYFGGFASWDLRLGRDVLGLRAGLVRQLAPYRPYRYVNAVSLGLELQR